MKAIALISGGIDSPVAAWIMRNKLELVFVHFNNFEHKLTAEKARELASIVDGKAKFIAVDFKPIQEEIARNCNRRFQCVLCKRMMYRIATKIAEQENADFLMTGENLAQVASQTLDNMAVIDKATELEVLRPLLCYDKEEIIRLAKQIGTHDLSISKSPECPFVPRKPLTKAKLEKVEMQEGRIEMGVLASNSTCKHADIH